MTDVVEIPVRLMRYCPACGSSSLGQASLINEKHPGDVICGRCGSSFSITSQKEMKKND